VWRAASRCRSSPPHNARGRAAELDTDRIGQDQLRDFAAGGDGDLGGEPSAEGKAQKRHLVIGQLVEHGEVEMDEVVDRVEVRRAFGVAEAGRGGGDELSLLAEQVEKRRLRMHGVEAVQQQQRRAAAAAQYLQLDPVHIHRRHVRSSHPRACACGIMP